MHAQKIGYDNDVLSENSVCATLFLKVVAIQGTVCEITKE